MATAFAGLKTSGTGTPQMQRYTNATPSVVDLGAVGVLETYTDNQDNSWNRVCRFGGGRVVLQFIADTIQRSTDDGRTWTTVHTTSFATSANQRFRSGIHPVYGADGLARLAAIVRRAIDGIMVALKSLDGITWTEVSTGFADAGAIGVAMVRVWRDNLVIWSSGLSIVQYNPQTDVSISTATGIASDPRAIYPIIWDDTIYWIDPNTAGASLLLRRLVAGVVTTVATIVVGNFTGFYKKCAFVDPSTNNLIVIAQDTSDVWFAFSITSGFVVTDVTATMLTGGTLAAFGINAMIRGVLIDQQANVAGVPGIFVYAGNSGVIGNTVSQFLYNGTATLLGGALGVPNDTGGDIAHTLVDQNVGGEHFFTAGSPFCETSGSGVLVANGLRKKTRLYATRTETLATIPVAATVNLATTPLTFSPVGPGTVTLKGVIAGVAVFVNDDGVGGFPVSALIPAGGTITYAAGTMTGTTAILDAGSILEVFYVAGTGTLRYYRTLATNEYPASVARANLSNPSEGAIAGGNENTGLAALGTESQVTIDMSTFTAGDRVSIDPQIVPT